MTTNKLCNKWDEIQIEYNKTTTTYNHGQKTNIEYRNTKRMNERIASFTPHIDTKTISWHKIFSCEDKKWDKKKYP